MSDLSKTSTKKLNTSLANVNPQEEIKAPLKHWVKVMQDKAKDSQLLTAKEAIAVITATKEERKVKRSRIYREGLALCNSNILELTKIANQKTVSYLAISNVRKGLTYPFEFKGEPKIGAIQTYVSAKMVKPSKPKLAKGCIYKSGEETTRGLYLLTLINDKGKFHTLEIASSTLDCLNDLYRFAQSEMIRLSTNLASINCVPMGGIK